MNRGLTLIEVLAVVVVLGLASGLTLGLSGSLEAQTRQSAIATIYEAIDQGRLVAGRDGGAWMHFGAMVEVVAHGTNTIKQAPDDRRTVWFREMPHGWTAQLVNPRASSRLYVDSLGCSMDARIVVEGPAGRVALELEGLSGRMTLVRDSEALR